MAICHCRPQIRRNDDGTTFPKPRNTQKSPDHEYIIPGMIVAPCFHQKRSQLAGEIWQTPPPPLSGEPQILIPHWNQTYKSTLHITRILYMTSETIHTLQNDYPTKRLKIPAATWRTRRTTIPTINTPFIYVTELRIQHIIYQNDEKITYYNMESSKLSNNHVCKNSSFKSFKFEFCKNNLKYLLNPHTNGWLN